jgi:hypothetical protein
MVIFAVRNRLARVARRFESAAISAVVTIFSLAVRSLGLSD